MTIHISARMAWHDNGWNGQTCQNPKANTYCVGQYSFPGDTIAQRRKLDTDGSCIDFQGIQPCIYSINTFGPDQLTAYAPPPDWFQDGTEVKTWLLPPYSTVIWPYEEMYKDEVLANNPGMPKYNAAARREAANDYFAQISPGHSLVFYYVNYSNPFSEDDQNRYVIVGVSRVKSVGDELTWVNQSSKMADRYGPNVWLRNITSCYPDQGLRIPYHIYMDRPEILDCSLFIPENSRFFKYATRHISDDGALGLMERLTEIVGILQDIGDSSENWEIRQDWISSIMAELWYNRGLFPGILRVWDYLKFREAIPFTIKQMSSQGETALKDDIFAFLQGDMKTIPGLSMDTKRISAVRKNWEYMESSQQGLLRDVLPRFDLQTAQIERIIERPQSVSIYAGHAEIADNAYILSEQYVGDNPDDQITFSQIDHGMFPSPDIGDGLSLDPDDCKRLRALCVQQLQCANQHTFLPAEQVLHGLNQKLSFMPDWKRAQFTQRHLEVEKEVLDGALTYRLEDNELYLYRKFVFDDERIIENTLRQMAARQDVELRFPVTEAHWTNYLKKPESELAQNHPANYEKAIAQQVELCQSTFRRPLSIICGAAGTGKTTIVEAIIAAIAKAHGSGTTFQLLAPTGKAADRLRERTNKEACTIHSFLAQHGWLNPNLTFRREGGRREDCITTFIIDESSMLDLTMLATFFRAVNWNAVQRLIFVGDPNQLTPIGIGKVFADLLDWLKIELPENVGELKINMRQLQNQLSGKGTGIIDFANIYMRRGFDDKKSADIDAQEEEILRRVQDGGDVAGDLRVLYWNTTDDLEDILLNTIVSDMENDTAQKLDNDHPDQLWNTYLSIISGNKAYPERSQVISPYRGELFGIEHINLVLQNHKSRWMKEYKGTLGGITYWDKVIQVRNRPQSDPIWAFNIETRKNEKIQVYNGQIGYTKVHGYDAKSWKWSGFRFNRFQVVFSHKQHYWADYTSESTVNDNLELAYAISVHKSQGSEFERVYFILPKYKCGLLSTELFYTGLTRAQSHCTLLIQEDIGPILSLRRRENSHLIRINSSLFHFTPVPSEFQTMFDWYEEGKIHRTLADYMVRSKSEVIIANILFDRAIPFEYEMPLYAPDRTFYLPDFTINWHGDDWYWEHEGMLHDEKYRKHQEVKHKWYKKHGFEDHLIVTTEESGFDSKRVEQTIMERLGI